MVTPGLTEFTLTCLGAKSSAAHLQFYLKLNFPVAV